MAQTRSWAAILLASAIICTCAEAFILRPLSIPDPFGLFSKVETVPKKRSVYIHSIKNNFYPDNGDGYGDDDADGDGGYTPGYYPKPDYTTPGYPKQDYPRHDHPKPGYPKHDYPKSEYPKSDYPKPDHPKPDYPKPDYPKPDYPKLDYNKPDQMKPGYTVSNCTKPDYPKPDCPKPDYPKSDCPKSDYPKSDYPKSDYPKSDYPKSDYHKSDYPKSDYPKSDYSKSDYPKSDYPKSDYPKSDYPKSDFPKSDYPKSDYPKSDYPKSDYPKSDYHKSDYPKPDYPMPAYTIPDNSRPDYPKQYLKPDSTHPTYPKPSDSKPDYANHEETAEKPQPDSSLIANIRSLIQEILQQEKGVKSEQYARSLDHESTTSASYIPRKNHYNRLQAHFLNDEGGPLRREYSQGRKNEIYEEENHRPVVYQTPSKLQRPSRDSDPEVTKASDQSTATTTAVPPEPIDFREIIRTFWAYLEIITVPEASCDQSGKGTISTVMKDFMAAVKETMDGMTTTTPLTTEAATEASLSPMDQSMAALEAALFEARKQLENWAGSSTTESPAIKIVTNNPSVPDRMDYEDFENPLTSTPKPQPIGSSRDDQDVTDSTKLPLSPIDIAIARLQDSLDEAKAKLQSSTEPSTMTEPSAPSAYSPTGNTGTVNIPLLPESLSAILEEFRKLMPDQTTTPAPANFEQKSPPPIGSVNDVQDIPDTTTEPTATTEGPKILNGIPIVAQSKRSSRHNYIQEQNEFPQDDDEEYAVRPRPSYAIAPRKPQAVRRYERPQTCPGLVDVPPPRYQQRPQQVRPRQHERYPMREQPRQVQDQHFQKVYRKPVPVHYYVHEEEDEEEEEEEQEQDYGYNQEAYEYPENEEQCQQDNYIRY